MSLSRSSGLLAAAVAAGGLVGGGYASGAPLTITNPGFNAPVASTFSYEGNNYAPGDPMPDHTFTTESTISGNVNNQSGIGDSATGAQIPGAGVDTLGYTGSPGTGFLRDSRDFVSGQGPDGSGALISSGDANLRGIFQTLAGTAFQDNTTYTFTAEVSDRRFGAGDNVQLHDTIQLSLAGGATEVTTGPGAGTFTFARPAPGSTSLATFTYTTAPSGDPIVGEDVTLILRAGGYTDNPNDSFVIAQTLFDNLTLNATPVPEPASLSLLGVAGLAVLRRRRA